MLLKRFERGDYPLGDKAAECRQATLNSPSTFDKQPLIKLSTVRKVHSMR